MPTYEYKCEACGHTFEKFQSITADPVKKCPVCGKAKVKRLLGTGAGLIFKGSGFYITDYRDAGYKEKAKADAGGSGGESKGDAKGGESKGDAKPAAAPAAAESKPAAKAEPAPAPKSEPKSGGSKSSKKKD